MNLKYVVGTLVPIFSCPSIILCSAKTNEYNDEKQKIKDYCLWDFIKLTGRQDAKIASFTKLENTAIGNGYLVGYDKGGYSVFSTNGKKIYMVNPYETSYSYSLVKTMLNNFYKPKNNIVPLDKPAPGDHKRLHDWDYSEFSKQKLINAQNAKPNEFKKLNIHPSKNGFIYADYEVKHSWWFKSISSNNYGINSAEYTYHKGDEYYNNFWKKYPSYYTKSGFYKKTADGGICGYVAMNMLIQYNEFFKGNGYISDEEYDMFYHFKKEYRNNISDYTHKTISNYIVPDLDPYFMNYLYQKTWFGDGVGRIWEYKYIGESILRDKWKRSEINYRYWTSSWVYAKHTINEWIRYYSTPLVTGGDYGYLDSTTKEYGGHVIAAYGCYNDGRFLANFGWNKNYSQVILQPVLSDQNVAIAHWTGKKVKKAFNWQNNLYDGKEMTDILKQNDLI